MKTKTHRQDPDRSENLERLQAEVRRFVLEQTAWLAQVQLPRSAPRKSNRRAR